MIDTNIRKNAIELRLQGKSYPEISHALGKNIPKSTMWSWFKDISLTEDMLMKQKNDNLNRLKSAREASLLTRSIQRREYLAKISRDNAHLSGLLENKDISKIVLAVLFLAEGSKRSGSVVFCNSDPFVISLFVVDSN